MIVEDFLRYMEAEREASPLTVRTYAQALGDYAAYVMELGDMTLEDADSDVIRDWMEHLMDSGHKASTVCKYLSAVKSLYRYALRMGIVKRDPAHPLQGPKKEKALPVFIKEQEADKLFDELQWDMDKIKDVRARTLLLLLYSTGIRRAEVIALRDSDVNLVSREIKVTGKRRKQRIIPLGDEIVTELQHYMALRDREQPGSEDTSNGALFRNDSGKALTEDNVYSTVRTYLTQVTTQKKRSPHVLRHSFATAMLNNDAQLGSVQKLLGHQSLTTTQIYTHVTFKDLKRTYSMAHPRENRK